MNVLFSNILSTCIMYVSHMREMMSHWTIYPKSCEIFPQLCISLIHQDGATVVGVGRTPAASSYIPAAELSPPVPQHAINLSLIQLS